MKILGLDIGYTFWDSATFSSDSPQEEMEETEVKIKSPDLSETKATKLTIYINAQMKEKIPFQVIRTTENLFSRSISEKKHFREVGSSRG